MSKKHYARYRDELYVNEQEHILLVRRSNSERTLVAICYHPRDNACHFAVRYRKPDGHVRVKFHSHLPDAFHTADRLIFGEVAAA